MSFISCSYKVIVQNMIWLVTSIQPMNGGATNN